MALKFRDEIIVEKILNNCWNKVVSIFKFSDVCNSVMDKMRYFIAEFILGERPYLSRSFFIVQTRDYSNIWCNFEIFNVDDNFQSLCVKLKVRRDTYTDEFNITIPYPDEISYKRH